MSFLSRPYQTLNRIEVSRSALKHNFHTIQNAHSQALVAPVLKSNAYGHGLKLVGKWVSEELKPPFLCVDSLFEAYELEKAGVKTPILILGYTFPQNFAVRRRLSQFHFPVYDVETLEALNKHQPGAKIHIKIDTGMHRLGIMPNQVPEFFKQLKDNDRVQVEGIYSHLSQADNPRKSVFTKNQVQLFKQVIAQFEAEGFSFRWKHIAATAAAMPHIFSSPLPDGAPRHQAASSPLPDGVTRHRSISSPLLRGRLGGGQTPPKNPNFINDPEFNLIRLGLGFYGYSPHAASSPLPKGAPRHQAISSPLPRGRLGGGQIKDLTSGIWHLASNLLPALTLKTHIVQIKTVEQGSEISYGGTFKAKKKMRIGVLPMGYYDGLSRKLSNVGKVLVVPQTPAPHTPYSVLRTSSIIGRICMNMTMIDLSHLPEARVGDSVEIISPEPDVPYSVEAIARLCDTISYEVLLSNLSETTKRVLV